MPVRPHLPQTAPAIARLDDVDSTNSYVVSQLDDLPHGLFVSAECQRDGRGRLGRSWHSPPGSVYMTGVVKPPCISPADDLAGFLTLSMAVSVCDVLENFGIEPTIQWPNDVLIGREKIGGVLAQAVWVDDRFVGVAVGVGVNVNMGHRELQRIDQPATSLRTLIGQSYDVRAIAEEVAAHFLQKLASPERAVLRADVVRRSPYLGSRVTVCTPRGTVGGLAADLDPSFSLVVADPRGARHVVQTGDLR